MSPTPYSTPKPRIAVIDLIKGILVFAILFHHAGILVGDSLFARMSDGVRTPSFFIIAGLFFPDNTSFHKLALNKINRLIIPYLFFAAIYYATDVLLNPTSILELSTPSDWYKFLFYNRNYPTWFLTALFYAYIVFYAIRPLLNRSSWFIQIAIVIAIGLAGRCLSEYLPSHFRENSIFSLWYFTHFSIGIEVIPLVYSGYMFKRSRFFTYSPPPTHRTLILVIAGIAWMTASTATNSLFAYSYGNLQPVMFASTISGFFFHWFICQPIQRLPYISYIGRYSIIVLGTHSIVLHVCGLLGSTSPWLNVAVTAAMMPPLIFVLTRYLPWLTAQRPLIPVPGERRRVLATSAPALEGAIAAEGQELGAENLRKL